MVFLNEEEIVNHRLNRYVSPFAVDDRRGDINLTEYYM